MSYIIPNFSMMSFVGCFFCALVFLKIPFSLHMYGTENFITDVINSKIFPSCITNPVFRPDDFFCILSARIETSRLLKNFNISSSLLLVAVCSTIFSGVD